MRFNLRNFVLAPVVMAAVALATQSAQAATTSIKVPFSFTVAGKTCPAGYYLVEKRTSQNMVTLQSKDASQSFTWTLNPGDPAPTDTRVILNFVGQDDTHALRSVQVGHLATQKLDKGSSSERPIGVTSGGR